MPFEVPITVGDRTFNARFENEPTDADIAEVVQHVKDPERGQLLDEGMQANLVQGFGKGLASTFLTGPGAVGEAFGAKDNFLLTEGRRIEGEIEKASPVSEENQ